MHCCCARLMLLYHDQFLCFEDRIVVVAVWVEGMKEHLVLKRGMCEDIDRDGKYTFSIGF